MIPKDFYFKRNPFLEPSVRNLNFRRDSFPRDLYFNRISFPKPLFSKKSFPGDLYFGRKSLGSLGSSTKREALPCTTAY